MARGERKKNHLHSLWHEISLEFWKGSSHQKRPVWAELYYHYYYYRREIANILCENISSSWLNSRKMRETENNYVHIVDTILIELSPDITRSSRNFLWALCRGPNNILYNHPPSTHFLFHFLSSSMLYSRNKEELLFSIFSR